MSFSQENQGTLGSNEDFLDPPNVPLLKALWVSIGWYSGCLTG